MLILVGSGRSMDWRRDDEGDNKKPELLSLGFLFV